MTHYGTNPHPVEVPLSLTPAEIKALREAIGELGYNLPGLTTADNKLRGALKAVSK